MIPGTTAPPRRSARATRIPVADVTAAFASVVVALTLALAAAYATAPGVRPWLGSEHGLVSWFTRGAYAGAAIVGVWAARRSPSDSRFRWVIPGVAVWGVLDTAHYGLGLIGVQPIEIGEIRVSSATSLADGLGRWAADLGLGTGLGAAGLVIVALGGYWVLRRASSWAAGRVMVTEPRVVGYLVLSCCCIAATPAVGLLGVGDAVRFASRLADMTGATLLVVAALAAGDHRRTVAGWRGRIRPWLGDRPTSDSSVGAPEHQ